MIELDIDEPWLGVDQGRPWPRWRGQAAVGVAALLLLLLTGPVGAAGSLTLAWRADAFAGLFWVGGGRAYTVGDSPSGLRLVSRDLATGRPRWARPLDGTLATLYRRGSMLLVSRFPPSPRSPVATRVVDTASGQTIGTYPVSAMPLVYLAEGVAVVVDREAPPPPVTPRPTPSTVPFDGWGEAHVASAVDLVTGGTRWTRRIDAGSYWVLPGVRPWVDGLVGDGSARWMAVIGPRGVIEVVDLATGRVTEHRQIGGLDVWSYVVALPDVLVVNAQEWPDAVLAGYDARSLSPVWRVQVPGVPDWAAWPVTCARLLCMASAYAIWGIDTDAERLVWRNRVVDVYDDTQPLLAATTMDGPVQIEVSTGEIRPLGGGWRIVDSRPGGAVLVVARSDPASRTRIGLLSRSDGAITTLDPIGPEAPGRRCHADGEFLACATGQELRVWRVGRS